VRCRRADRHPEDEAGLDPDGRRKDAGALDATWILRCRTK
jgi:hypothetical protein